MQAIQHKEKNLLFLDNLDGASIVILPKCLSPTLSQLVTVLRHPN